MAEFNTAVKRTLGFILLVCVCVGQTACTTTKPVVVPAGVRLEANISQQYDSISRDHIRFIWLTPGVQHDTLHILDSIYIDRWRVKTDSIVRIDTVTHVVEIVKPGNQFLVRSGIALWVIIVLIVLAIAAGIFIKFAK